MSTLAKPPRPEWNPAFYDEAYYGQGGRNGFTSYKYGSLEQQQQLALKWQFCEEVPHRSALFVGCALGFEVAYWLARNKLASGYDVSKWAIEHQIPEAKQQCALYNGAIIPESRSSIGLVASFDVLSHLPDEILFPLVKSMCSVASDGIVFRVVVKNWRNMNDAVDGLDGSWIRYRPFEQWDRLFSESGKFQLHWMKMHQQYEVTAIYKRT